jgi:hypothetical protein
MTRIRRMWHRVAEKTRGAARLGLGEEEGRFFFFEKKKQKTFAHGVWLFAQRGGADTGRNG